MFGSQAPPVAHHVSHELSNTFEAACSLGWNRKNLGITPERAELLNDICTPHAVLATAHVFRARVCMVQLSITTGRACCEELGGSASCPAAVLKPWWSGDQGPVGDRESWRSAPALANTADSKPTIGAT